MSNSLTLFFIVLSLAIGYLLYDTFSKSRQKTSKVSQAINNKLKINYSHECAVLNSLSKQKLDSIKTKTISISLSGDSIEPTQSQLLKVRQVVQNILKTRRLYLLENRTLKANNLFKMLKQLIGPDFTIPFNSCEGAIALLRQMSCGLHLQSNKDIYLKIRQYVPKIWFVGTDTDKQALRQFKSEVQMLSLLQYLQFMPQVQNK